jgi:hypothetical protein
MEGFDYLSIEGWIIRIESIITLILDHLDDPWKGPRILRVSLSNGEIINIHKPENQERLLLFLNYYSHIFDLDNLDISKLKKKENKS